MTSCNINWVGVQEGNSWDCWLSTASSNAICIAFTTPNESGYNCYNGLSISINDSNSVTSGSRSIHTYLIDGDVSQLSSNPSNYIASSTILYNFNSSTSFELGAYGLSPNTMYILILVDSGTTATFKVNKYDVSISSDGSNSSTPSYNYSVSYWSDGATWIASDAVKYGDTYKFRSALTEPPETPKSDTSTFTITGVVDIGGASKNKSIIATKIVTTQYVFAGWELADTDTVYTAESSIKVSELFPDEMIYTISLIAKWVQSTSVIYKNNTIANLGSATKPDNTTTYSVILNNTKESTSETLTTDSVTSYIFKGWGSTKSSTIALKNSKSYTSDTTVYAIWESTKKDQYISLPNISKDYSTVVETYTITYNPMQGTVNRDYDIASKIESYKFLGWSSDENINNIANNNYLVTKDIILYTVWKPYYITESIDLPIPIHENKLYRFSGWSIKDTTEILSSPYIPEESVALCANYKLGKDIKAFIYHNNKWWRIKV